MAIPSESYTLCRCLRSDDTEAKAAFLKDLSYEAWEGVLSLSNRMGVTPLLWDRLSDLCLGSRVPAEIQGRLRRSYFSTVRRNAFLYERLARIVKVFSEAGVRVIVLKGAHLAEFVYGNIGLRPMADIDLLVRKRDLEVCAGKLGELGYTASTHVDIEASCAAAHHLPVFECPGGVRVEIHSCICPPRIPLKLGLEDAWARSREVDLAGLRAHVLSPEDLLIHICVHASYQHLFAMGIRPLCDVCEIVNRYERDLNWGVLLERAEAAGVARGVSLTLLLAHELLGAALPEPVLNSCRQAAPDLHALEYAGALATTAVEDGMRMNPLLGRMCDDASLLQKLLVMARSLFLSRAQMHLLYKIPKGMLPLWYAVRAKDLFVRYRDFMWRLMSGKASEASFVSLSVAGNRLFQWMTGTERRVM